MIHKNLKREVGSLFSFPGGILPGDVGIELEIEGENLPKQAAGWNVHVDPSLRGAGSRLISVEEDLPDTPREYVTAGAIPFSDVSGSCSYLHGLLSRKGTVVRLTPRASTHFHVNMQQYTLRDVWGFLMVYTIVEPVLLRLCGPLRNGNLFCIPCTESGDLPDYIGKCYQAIETGLFRYFPSENAHTHRGKYAALNVDPLNRLGTLEIRCFPNEYNPAVITKWAGWLANIRAFAKNWPAASYSDLHDYAVTHDNYLLSTIFGHESLWAACAPNNSSQLVEHGVECSYEIFKAGERYLNLKPKSGKTVKQRFFDHNEGGYVELAVDEQYVIPDLEETSQPDELD